jgi:hypothetical protein
MGYPIRWEQVADPEVCDAPDAGAEAQSPSLRAYYRRVVALTLAVSGLFVLLVVGVSSVSLIGLPAPGLRLDSALSGATLAAKPPTVSRRLGFVSVSGSVTNKSARTLDNVEAVVDLVGADGKLLRTQSAILDGDRVDPRQTASFRVEMADVPGAAAYRLRFRKLFGGELK